MKLHSKVTFLAAALVTILCRISAGAQLRVLSVQSLTPAETAGLKPGDTIVAWQQGQDHGPIAWPIDLLLIYRERRPRADSLTLLGKRAGKDTSWTLAGDQPGMNERPWGLQVESAAPQIKPLLDHTKELLEAKNFDVARDYARSQSLQIAADDGGRAYFLYQTGNLFAAARRMKEATVFWDRAIAETPANLPYFRPLIYRAGDRYSSLSNDLASAFAYLDKAIHEWETLRQWPLNLASDLATLSINKTRASAFEEAIALGERALKIRLSIAPHHESTATALQNLGDSYLEAGKLEPAEKLLKQGLEIIKDAKAKTETRAELYFALAALYHDKGVTTDSEKYFLLCQDELKDIPREENLTALVWSNLGVIAIEHHNFARAEYFLSRTVAYDRKIGSPSIEPQLARSLSTLGYLKFLTHDDRNAKDLLQEALSIQERISASTNDIVETLGDIGYLLQRQGDLSSAESYFQRSLSVAVAINPHSYEAATSHRSLGSLYSQEGRLTLAEAEFRTAAAVHHAAEPAGLDYPEDLASLAAIEEKLGKPAAAGDDYRKALSLFNLKTASLGRSDSVHLRATFSDYNANFAAFLLNQGQTALAFNVLDNSRARTLVLTLATSQVSIRNRFPAALLESDRKLESQLATLSDTRTQALAGKDHTHTVAGIEARLAAVSAEHDMVENAMCAASPRYAALSQKKQVSLRQIQQMLEPETAILEYSLGKEHSYVLAVDRTRVRSFPLPPKGQIDSLAQATYQNWSKRGESVHGALQTSQTLSRIILSPVADFIKGKYRLLIVADGMLQYIPFAALPIPKLQTPSPFASKYEIVSLPSASLLATLRQLPRARTTSADSLAVISDPVFTKDDPRVTGTQSPKELLAASRGQQGVDDDNPDNLSESVETIDNVARGVEFNRLVHSREEAEAIASVSAAKNHLFMAMDFDANRAAALQPKVTNSHIVHFATHGIFDAKNPAMSGLIFSLVDKQGKPQPGFLGLDSIYSSHFSSDLIVLSACETALGEDVDGEGLVGLTWGFIYAGAKSVVASLWRVNDASTAELMRLFYEGMQRRGLRPASALREAQLAIAGKPQWAAPYYWAGFIIEGDYGR